MKKNLLLALAMMAGGISSAATYNASSAALTNVQAAVSLAMEGDTVNVPAGSATWTSGLTITNDIILSVAGIGQTVITDGGASATTLIRWTTSTNFPARLTGFTFQGTPGQIASYSGEFLIYGNSLDFRVDHCQFINFSQEAFETQIQGGLFDHNQYFNTNFENFVECWGYNYGGTNADALGDGSWSMPMGWGTTNAVYIENNTITYTGNPLNYNYPGPAVDDAFAGARIVFRYNLVTNMFFQDHGTESSQMRSGRGFEVYENNFYYLVGTVFAQGVPLEFRGGTAVVFSNVFWGNSSLMELQDFRSTDAYPPFLGGNGQNPWDTNNPALITSGTHTGTNSSPFLEDSNATWTVNQYVGGYEVLNISNGGTNTGSFSIIYTNSVHDAYVLGNEEFIPMLWTNGQAYKIYQSYRHLDQCGSGIGDIVYLSNGVPLNLTTGKASWVHQPPEPIYQWGNSFNGAVNPVIGQTVYSSIVSGRDYIDNVAKPGYAPLVYPHPMSSGIPIPNVQPPGFSISFTGTIHFN